MTTATTTQLIELATPFVGVRLGAPLEVLRAMNDPAVPAEERAALRAHWHKPRTAAIDIHRDCHAMIDADVRAVSDQGIKTVRNCHADVMDWADVRSITIRSIDEMGDTISSVQYRHQPADAAPALVEQAA